MFERSCKARYKKRYRIITKTGEKLVIIIIQFNSILYLFIYVLTQHPKATYRVSTDTNNRNNGQHRGQYTETRGL
jgi:hypothetical protein